MTSSYYLAVDVGTSRTAAATARLAPDGSLLATPFSLGRSSDSAPSAMFVTGGELLFGDAAERRGITEPDRLVREFKRRIGDDVPILAGDQRFTPEEVYALMVAWVVDLVAERESRLPNAIAVTVPVAWGQYRIQLVEDALARHGWSSVTLVTEPEAAARHYESTSPLAAGRALAVYDLGGGTFDAIVLQKDAAGAIRIAGAPVGLGDLGGSDFDDAVLRHTLAVAQVAPESLGVDERIALAALRRECVDAKESLSFDSEAVIPVLLGSGHGTVRLTRDEFEGMIAERVDRTTEALAEALESAGVRPTELDSILLTGGSSRIPYVAQVLSERFDRPIAIDADPKAIIALGAVRVLSDHASAPVRAAALPVIPVAASAVASAPDSTAVEADAVKKARREPDGETKSRKWRLPTFAYLSAGSLVLGMGLVVASATAMDNGAPVTQSDSTSLLNGLLAAGLSAGAPEAANAVELPPTQAQPVAPQPQSQAVSDTTQAPAPTKNVGRRAGPKAATTARITTAPTNSASSRSSGSHASAAGSSGSSSASNAQASAASHEPTTQAAPSESPSTEPSPAETTTPPSTEPTTDPIPSDSPTTDPPATDPPATDPPATDPPATDPPATDPTDPPASDPGAQAQSTESSDPAPSPTATAE